ncbi:MAG: EAL domain-containing protein [Burkholderiaceae bacterium]
MHPTLEEFVPQPTPSESEAVASGFVRWAMTSPAALDAPQTGIGDLSPARPSGLHEVTVMMVDDEPLMTDIIQTYLEEEGYRRFVSINDALLAIEAARRHRPGLILLDLMMPGLSGFDILKQIRSDAALRYTPVIILTAASNTATKLKALELGATEFLSKPVDPSELVLRVRNSLVFKVYQDRLANQDLLTGLPNQRVFAEQLQLVLGRARQEHSSFAMLHIGLDRFKQINDSLGHSAGDTILKAIALRLQGCARRTDALLLSRLEGDEFGLLMPGIESAEVANRMARRILAAMSKPLQQDGQDLFVTPSIGISVYPGDGLDDAALRRNAAAAMAHAKSSGRNTFEFYSAELNSASLERLSLETQLRRAIERDELVLHYQAKVDFASGRIVGAEALARWMRPGVGMVPPAQFIPIAEEIGLIVEIGEWVIAATCAQMAAWRDAGLGDVKVAVNVTRHDMMAGGLVRAVARAITRHGIKHGQLVIELTESMLVDRVEHTRKQLEALQVLGVELAIDDFGTGYSSMNYLKRFPLDELKIDKSFVDGTPGSATDCAIVKAMIVLAHSLGMRAVAEGVETAAQRDLLLSLGCDSYQGYLFSKPVPAEAFKARLLSWNPIAP